MHARRIRSIHRYWRTTSQRDKQIPTVSYSTSLPATEKSIISFAILPLTIDGASCHSEMGNDVSKVVIVNLYCQASDYIIPTYCHFVSPHNRPRASLLQELRGVAHDGEQLHLLHLQVRN